MAHRKRNNRPNNIMFIGNNVGIKQMSPVNHPQSLQSQLNEKQEANPQVMELGNVRVGAFVGGWVEGKMRKRAVVQR